MKGFKKFFTASVAILIVLFLAGVFYVVLFHKEEPAVKEPEKAAPKIITPRVAVPPSKIAKRKIAIIVDDIGNDLRVVRDLQKIRADLTFAILPFQRHSREAAEMLHKAKKEILLHLPMEPVSYPQEKPGEGALFTEMNDEELLFQLRRDLAAVPHAIGVNNHMGSKFMTEEGKLVLIFKELKTKNLFFVDSRTTPDSKAPSAAKKTGLAFISREIFLDDSHDYAQTYKVLVDLVKRREHFPVVIIGHPYPGTIRAIRDAVGMLYREGIVVIPVSQMIQLPGVLKRQKD